MPKEAPLDSQTPQILTVAKSAKGYLHSNTFRRVPDYKLRFLSHCSYSAGHQWWNSDHRRRPGSWPLPVGSGLAVTLPERR